MQLHILQVRTQILITIPPSLPMKNILKFSSIAILCILALSGCIKDDLPFPRIQQDILSIAANGEVSPANIDTKELSVNIQLGEEVNPKQVTFSDFTFSPQAECSLNLLEGVYDLSRPLKLTLSLYQDYVWTISASQSVERYFTVAGQIGETAIDVPGKRIVLYVPKTLDKKDLTVTSVKLGPQGVTQITPSVKDGDSLDCSRPVQFTVKYFDTTEIWTLYVDTSEAIVSTTQVDAWVNVIWAYGSAPEDAQNSFQYKPLSASEWIDVDPADVIRKGGTFSVCIPHLAPLTDYVVRAVSDTNTGNEVTVKTGVAIDLPNASFDSWWKDGKIWCPWAEGMTSWWDTSNTGAATLGQGNVSPSQDTPSGSGLSVRLESRFVGIGAIGKFAAGSIFSGSFVRVDGTNGILDFGRTWDAKPTKLTGYFKYKTSDINYTTEEFKYLEGRPDTCHIWVALTDLSAPWQIRTNPRNRQLFDKNHSGVIAYGEFSCGENTDSWQQFEIDIDYRSTSRTPTYLLVVMSASKYGDYFTGGTGTVLNVDDLSLHYDY